MDADVLADDELHPRQPDAVVRQHGGLEGELGIAEVHHDGGARPLARCDATRHLECQLAVVDVTDVALRAAHRDDATGLQRFRRGCRADHGRHAELAGDDCRVASAPATDR